ncbi:hypothetical protein GGS23DRAFT_42483 [Durotheca rogersii]|uniref:uncharacterized protein n=1 Tax=Durotheca rogersii TaxID=419775 RepID=UPI00221EF269|nr:uncharacterized protein GGS23DRAFT_42483 [Durotheca rogersii]KAI5868647.1 hypothetical protein GGS23DRAFT_42483 [Durotheca rogersii]
MRSILRHQQVWRRHLRPGTCLARYGGTAPGSVALAAAAGPRSHAYSTVNNPDAPATVNNPDAPATVNNPDTPTTVSNPDTPTTVNYPDAPTTEHHDRASYLAYAERSGLNRRSTTYIGTEYEYTVAEALGAFQFALKRVGGRSDKGIDLLGTWRVPCSYSAHYHPAAAADAAPVPSKTLRVLVQCKATSSAATRVGPQNVRELASVFHAAPPGWRAGVLLAVLATPQLATPGIRDAMARSRWPIGYVSCSRAGRVGQFIWNQAADLGGLQGLGLTRRFSDDPAAQSLVLTWKGKLFVLRDPPDPAAAADPPQGGPAGTRAEPAKEEAEKREGERDA